MPRQGGWIAFVFMLSVLFQPAAGAQISAQAQPDSEDAEGHPGAAPGSEAEAVTQSRSSEFDEARYAAHVKDALAAFNAGHFARAYDAFERAHAVQPSARTLRGLGLSAYYKGDFIAAGRALRAALDADQRPLTAGQRKELQSALASVYTKVGRLRLAVTPSEARVRIDGELLRSVPPQGLLVVPGVHRLEGEADGHHGRSRDVSVQPGELVTAELVLTVRESEPQRISLAVPPASVPLQRAALDTARPDTPSRPPLRAWTWTLLGGAAALGGASALVWYEAQKRLDHVARACERETCTPAGRDQRISDAHLSRLQATTNALWISSALLATSALILAAVDARQRRRPQRSVRANFFRAAVQATF